MTWNPAPIPAPVLERAQNGLMMAASMYVGMAIQEGAPEAKSRLEYEARVMRAYEAMLLDLYERLEKDRKRRERAERIAKRQKEVAARAAQRA